MNEETATTSDPVETTNEKASSEESEGNSKVEKTEKLTESDRNETESPRKRKIDERSGISRSDDLDVTKKLKLEEEKSNNDVPGPSASETTSEASIPTATGGISSENPQSEIKDDVKQEERATDVDIAHNEKKTTKNKKSRSVNRETSSETDPLKIWTVTDDLALVTAISHVSCLRFIHNTLRFSRNFTFADLEDRFRQLMYDEKMSSEARKRMSQMPVRQRLHIESRTPFSRTEEKCLMESAESVLQANRGDKYDPDNHTLLKIEHFKMILDKNRQVFHRARTPQSLSDHFRRIKGYKENSDETKDYQVLEHSNEVTVGNFDFHVPLQACRARFHAISRRPALSGILNRFKTSATVPDNAIAMIHGQFLQYPMTQRCVVMGRSSLNEKVDIDLSKEGPASKISRRQAEIRHVASDFFTIENVGQRPIYVDSKPLPQMVTTSLKHGSIIEIASLRLIFSIPVLRTLHPLTRQTANQHRKLMQQNYQNQSFGGPPPSLPAHPPPPKKPRGKVGLSGGRKLDSAEKERLLKAVGKL